MARGKNPYKCFPLEPSEIEKVTLVSGTLKTELENEKKTHTETPSPAKRATMSLAGAFFRGRFQMPTLATGEVVVKMVLWINYKTSTAENDGEALITTTGGVGKLLNSTAQVWGEQEQINGIPLAATAARREVLEYKVARLKGTLTIYEMYLEIETETETSVLNSSMAVSEPTGTANAEKKFKTGTFKWKNAGLLAIISVATNSGSGASAVTDSTGNTWQKDAEASHGSSDTVQIWSCILKEASESVTVTVTVSAEGEKVALCIGEYAPIVSSGRVDVSATGNGSGTEASTAAITTRASQGDLVVASFVALGGAKPKFTGKAPLGLAAAAEMGSSGLTVWQGVTSPPTGEATAFTSEATITESASWAGVTVAYTVLAGEEAAAIAAMVMMV